MQPKTALLCTLAFLAGCAAHGNDSLRKQCDDVQRQLTESQAKQRELEDELRVRQDQLHSAKDVLAVEGRREGREEALVAEYKALLARFKPLMDAGTLRVRIADGRMVLALPTDVLFESGSAKLSKTGKDAVEQVGRALTGNAGRRVQVEGHTDNVPIHDAAYRSNWELASARALVVLHSLIESGVQPASLSGASYGEFHPVAGNESEHGRAENRRIDLVLPADLSGLPSLNEVETAIGLEPTKTSTSQP